MRTGWALWGLQRYGTRRGRLRQHQDLLEDLKASSLLDLAPSPACFLKFLKTLRKIKSCYRSVKTNEHRCGECARQVWYGVRHHVTKGKSPLRRFTPSWTFTRVACDCLLPFVHPLLSQVGGAAGSPANQNQNLACHLFGIRNLSAGSRET